MLRIEDRMETVFTIERKTNVFYNCDIAKNVTVRMKIFRFFLITCATIFAPARLRNIYHSVFFFFLSFVLKQHDVFYRLCHVLSCPFISSFFSNSSFAFSYDNVYLCTYVVTISLHVCTCKSV